tara:strand:- start:373 stop:513 length:141 start_codon:yes stop_codon:yes gene_type:complete
MRASLIVRLFQKEVGEYLKKYLQVSMTIEKHLKGIMVFAMSLYLKS